MTLTRRDALAELWRRGRLDYKLRPYQRRIRDAFYGSRKMFAARCGRRMGKTFTFCVVGVEACLAKPRARVMYAFPTQRQARKVVVATMQKVLDDCPAQYRPIFNKVDLVWTFPNGSVFHLSGCDDETAADNLRGDEMDLGIVDEAGFNPVLRYLLDSVLMPQTLTTGGKIALISTPPREGTGHYFYTVYAECQAQGAAVHLSTREAEPWLAAGELDELIARAGGPESVAARREYDAEFIADLEAAVVPEFTEHKEHLVREFNRPMNCRKVVSADFGFNDWTVVVFAVYDFDRDLILFEDEVVTIRESALAVGHKVRAKIQELGYHDATLVADAPLQLLADIYEATGVTFGPAQKDDAVAAINNVRRACAERRIRVHPRCQTTVSHLENAIWNARRTDYERSETSGHYDGVDAVKYALRAIDRHTNPHPRLQSGVSPETHWIPPGLQSDTHQLAEAFKWR